MSDLVRHYDFHVPDAFSWFLTLPNPIFLPPAHSPARIYFGRENVWWVTCNCLTGLKEKNINANRKSTTCAICWLKSVIHEEKRREKERHNIGWSPTLFSCSRRFSSCITDFSQQMAQVVLFRFAFMFFSFKPVGQLQVTPKPLFRPKLNKKWGVCGWQKNWTGKG
jgi:hypothetical protein